MKIEFDKTKISNEIGVEFEKEEDYILYIQELLDFFKYHNRNLTEKQDFKIKEITTILENIK